MVHPHAVRSGRCRFSLPGHLNYVRWRSTPKCPRVDTFGALSALLRLSMRGTWPAMPLSWPRDVAGTAQGRGPLPHRPAPVLSRCNVFCSPYVETMRQRDLCVDSGAFDSLARSIGSRRRAVTVGLGGVLSALGLTAAHEANAGSKGKKKKKKEAKKKKKAVDSCLANNVPFLCDPYITMGAPATYPRCVSEVTNCCQLFKYSRGSYCSCIESGKWGFCT